MAARAASSTSAGPSSSGNPWPRLIAPVRAARADISAKMVAAIEPSSPRSPAPAAVRRQAPGTVRIVPGYLRGPASFTGTSERRHRLPKGSGVTLEGNRHKEHPMDNQVPAANGGSASAPNGSSDAFVPGVIPPRPTLSAADAARRAPMPQAQTRPTEPLPPYLAAGT